MDVRIHVNVSMPAQFKRFPISEEMKAYKKTGEPLYTQPSRHALH